MKNIARGRCQVFVGVGCSSKHDVATCANAVHHHPVATMLDVEGEDQAPIRVLSFLPFLFCADFLMIGFPRVVYVLLDCQSALASAAPVVSECPLLAKRLQ